jgi:hypothetical protein
MGERLRVHPLRLEQIQEAMDDLEAVFADPTCFHSEGSYDDRPVQDYALSLASEFVGGYRDDEITSRLAKLIAAEDRGRPKDARHHLGFVRRKIDARLREWWSQIVTNPQVADTRFALEAFEISKVASTTKAVFRPVSRVSLLEPVGASS